MGKKIDLSSIYSSEDYYTVLQLLKKLIETIEDMSVGGGELEDGSVTSDKIADGSVTSDKIADGSVTSDKIANDLNFLKSKVVKGKTENVNDILEYCAEFTVLQGIEQDYHYESPEDPENYIDWKVIQRAFIIPYVIKDVDDVEGMSEVVDAMTYKFLSVPVTYTKHIVQTPYDADGTFADIDKVNPNIYIGYDPYNLHLIGKSNNGGYIKDRVISQTRVVIGSDKTGDKISDTSNAYINCAVRGDDMVSYVDAKTSDSSRNNLYALYLKTDNISTLPLYDTSRFLISGFYHHHIEIPIDDNHFYLASIENQTNAQYTSLGGVYKLDFISTQSTYCTSEMVISSLDDLLKGLKEASYNNAEWQSPEVISGYTIINAPELNGKANINVSLDYLKIDDKYIKVYGKVGHSSNSMFGLRMYLPSLG